MTAHPAISYGSRKPFQEWNFCRLMERKSEIYLATLARSCSASELEVAWFFKIRNHKLRFLLPEELWIGKSELELRFLGIGIVPPLVGVDTEVTASKLQWHKPRWAAPRIFVSGLIRRTHRTRRVCRLDFGFQQKIKHHMNPHGVGFQKIKKFKKIYGGVNFYCSSYSKIQIFSCWSKKYILWICIALLTPIVQISKTISKKVDKTVKLLKKFSFWKFSTKDPSVDFFIFIFSESPLHSRSYGAGILAGNQNLTCGPFWCGLRIRT